MTDHNTPWKGRGAVSNRDSRFNSTTRAPLDDDVWQTAEADTPQTRVEHEQTRTIISRNRSPDIPFDRSINPYRGCEHGCIYCYARPTHAYLGLSPGLDFETRLVVKRGAAAALSKEFGHKNYACKAIALGANTDPYQPIERSYRTTRKILQVLHDCHHPVTITTKSALIERDLDLIVPMSERNLVEVQISLTTLDKDLARVLEPRASSPLRRLKTLETLSAAGIPTRVAVAPVIPFMNDAEMETLIGEAARCGASGAGYVVLRLPLEIAELFREWLVAHFPMKTDRVLNCLRQIHGGRTYDSRFEIRQSGTGVFAELLQQRFKLALKRNGLNADQTALDTSLFRPPKQDDRQMDLF